MAKCIAVVNQKGGVGKTTTSVNLAASLAYYGQRVLLVDMDPQANASSGLGIDKRNVDGTVYQLLSGDKTLDQVLHKTAVENLQLIPAHIDLIGAEIELIESESREQILKNHLSKISANYDFIFMDCPPSLGLLTLNALCAAAAVLIPMQCEYYALEGLSVMLRLIEQLKSAANPKLEITGIVMTMVSARTNLGTQVAAEVRTHFPDKIFNATIPRTVRLAEAPSFGKPIIVYDPSSAAATAYRALADELLARCGIAVPATVAPPLTIVPPDVNPPMAATN